MPTIRPVRLPADHDRLLALDRSFTTDRAYRVVSTTHSFALEEVELRPPVYKDFPLTYDLEHHTWEVGLVAELDGAIIGFVAFTHQQWNRRTNLWHLYVAPAQRGQGLGRQLIEEVVAAARAAGTRCVWLETSTLAYPAIRFYRHLGFELCGLDTSLYDTIGPAAGETALYFTRAL
jgi:ribosomal protein S18 acetylase RimI-like enzyme